MPKRYSEEFKHKVIQRYEKGESIKDLSQEFHIAQSTIYHWRKLFCSIQTPQHTYTPKEFDVLSRKLEKMEHEVEIIRLSGFLAKVPLRRKVEVLEKIYHENQQFSVHELCEALGVARGTFYNHIFRRVDRSKREEEQAELMLRVQQIFDDSQQRFGAEKIRTILEQNGMKVSAKRISAIMQELDLRSIRSDAKKQYKSGSNMQNAIYSKENSLWSVQTRYGSVILHTLGSTTIGYISVSFWISMHAGSWVTEYLVTPVPTWLLPHFEMLIRNAASRKI